MAITGQGTQANPFIVHSYSEFMSKSNCGPSENISNTYHTFIKFFDEPNQVIDCNDYGSEFTWGNFEINTNTGTHTVHIDLNGCTIKNFIIGNDKSMFNNKYFAINGNSANFEVKNGKFKNVFLGNSGSKVSTYTDGGTGKFQDVSFSINASKSGSAVFKGSTLDNCFVYISTGTALPSGGLLQNCSVTDTDFKIYIANQNNKAIFPDTTFTDCRFTGKVGGVGQTFEYNADTCVLDWCGMNGKTLNFTNCVVDLDLTDGRIVSYAYGGSKYDVFLAYNGYDFGTNVVCNSHRPVDEGHSQFYGAETAWNFMSHEHMRDADYLNNAGFTVVDVSGG